YVDRTWTGVRVPYEPVADRGDTHRGIQAAQSEAQDSGAAPWGVGLDGERRDYPVPQRDLSAGHSGLRTERRRGSGPIARVVLLHHVRARRRFAVCGPASRRTEADL